MRGRYRKGFLYLLLVLLYGYMSAIFLQSQQNSQDGMLERPVDWVSRVQRVHSVCQKQPVLVPKPTQITAEAPVEMVSHFTKMFHKTLIYNIVRIPSLELDWCLVPKVASTSLSKVLLKHLPRPGGSPPSPYIQEELWTRAGHLSWDQFKSANYTRFLIARHPFARVASAYRNKLEDKTVSHDGLYFYNTYSKNIIRMVRGKFEDNAAEPSFIEFVDYLLNTKAQADDEHWQPVSLRCRLCQLEYTHILKYEDLSSEWESFVQSISKDLDLDLPWQNKGQTGSLKKYYSQIPREKIAKLAMRYEADFNMFEYTLEDDF